MPLVYMNSWGSLALRAVALAINAVLLLGASAAGSPRLLLAAAAVLLASSAAHPLSVALRLGGGGMLGLLAVAEGVVSLALAAVLVLAAFAEPQAGAHAAALAAPLALGLAVVALVGGVGQHDRLMRTHGGRWPAMPVAIAVGSAGVAIVAALQAEAVAHGADANLGAAVVAASALAAWVTHSALRLRRARRLADRARQRDWALVRSRRPVSAQGPVQTAAGRRRLDPVAQWS
jgi:hypothetical protein